MDRGVRECPEVGGGEEEVRSRIYKWYRRGCLVGDGLAGYFTDIIIREI